MAGIMTDAMGGTKSNNSTFLKYPTRPKPDSLDLRIHIAVSLSVCMTGLYLLLISIKRTSLCIVDHQDEYPSREWVSLQAVVYWVHWTGPLPYVVCLAVAIDALKQLALLFGRR